MGDSGKHLEGEVLEASWILDGWACNFILFHFILMKVQAGVDICHYWERLMEEIPYINESMLAGI